MKQFDPNEDEYYSINDTPDLYLDDKQVEAALSKIKVTSSEAENRAREILKKSEKIHKDELFGKYSHEQAVSEIQKLENDFGNKFGFWPSASETYEQFYEQFSGE